MTVFGKGLSRLLVLYTSTRPLKAASFSSPLPPPPPPALGTYTLLITVLGLFSNKRANSYKVGLKL